MRKLLVASSCIALALVLCVPAGTAAPEKSGSQTKVICRDEKTLTPEAKVTPRHCIFHKRHAPTAEAFFVRTKHDHWSHWGRDRAKGRGRSQGSMGPSTPVRIRLKDPIKRCGRRVFSEAHFRFPKLGGHGTSMNIDVCAK